MSKKIVSMWAAIGFFVLLGFQNCSKVSVLDKAAQNPSMAIQGNGDGATPDVPDSGQVSNPDVPGGSGSMPDQPKDPSSPTPPPSNNDHSTTNPPSDPSNPSNPSNPSAPTNPPVVDLDGDDPIGPINEGDAAALCMAEAGHQLKNLGLVSVLSGSSISNVRGPVLLEVTVLKSLSNIRGIVIIKGKSASATVSDIENIRGATVLCGLSVDKISDTRGSLVLVNSSVKAIDNHRGSIKVMNSEIGSTSNIRGSIHEIQK